MLRYLAIALIAAITISSTPAFAKAKGAGKGSSKSGGHHGKHRKH